ncbi:SET and MYND domain-containing protein 4-like isoform X2 [Armigeres subalbatus]|uniref:SET and MYND domain-containing protein 4-like isoform X2 n=1 Tax=Armigeres subalbatus TaxID=124917 RepID=UPI002ED4C8C0
MEICEETGFFHDDFAKFRSGISESEFKAFSQLENDAQRVRFVHEIVEARHGGKLWNPVREIGIGKNLTKAVEIMKRGDSALQYEKWQDALQCYNDACLLLPSGDDTERALILASRSSSLFHLNKYDLALHDIELSFKLNYPEDMRYKLFERKAQIFSALKNFPAALDCYRETFTALHACNLDREMREKRLKETHKLIVNLDLYISNIKKYLEPIKRATAKEFVPHMDKSLFFDCTESEGRFARTRNNLKPNNVLLKEQPHASVVMPDCSGTHCDQCGNRIEVLFSCPYCVDVVYCSENCQKLAPLGYHRFECGFLTFVRKSGANVVAMLALRIVSQKSEEYFYNMQDKLDHLSNDFVDSLPFDDYRKVYNFVTHSEQRNPEDYLKWTAMSVLLNTVLVAAGFCKSSSLKGILLHNLQIVTYNSHEISELQRRKPQDPGVSVCIGAGLYPSLVLFNHSCDPGITRYFVGNVVYVRTIKNIPAGSIVAENYGQLYTRANRRERRKLLAENYKFECCCQACEDDWPSVHDMDPTMVRFKCGATEGCGNGLVFRHNSVESELKCGKCGGFTDVNDAFEALKKADFRNRYNEAVRFCSQGQYELALSKYASVMNSLDELLVHPFMEYHFCQQGIRRCSLELGNRFIDLKCAQ